MIPQMRWDSPGDFAHRGMLRAAKTRRLLCSDAVALPQAFPSRPDHAMAGLPIDAVLPQLLDSLARAGTAVLIAPPGAGKTTRVPPALLARDRPGEILVLEPRRVATRAAARRMALEMGEALGETVGYQLRLDRKTSPRTRIRVVTEGILTRKLQSDPSLEGVSTVLFDEFHERHLQADLALALLAEVRRDLREDLEVVVMSATLDPGPVSRFLGGAPIVSCEGRLHPVTLHHDEVPQKEAMEEKVSRAVSRALEVSGRDVLVFLPGAAEILRCKERILRWATGVSVLPLHGELPAEEQDRAIASGAQRRVILATNIAESSLTIEGLDAVVDLGLVKRIAHDPSLGMDRLECVPISLASADQRTGRAGRLGPGHCFRLWTKSQEREMEERETPEIQRVDLCGTILELLAWGVRDFAAFPWFEAPPEENISRALKVLRVLEAIAESPPRLTPLGRQLARLPIHPRLGRMILEAQARGVARDGCLLAALASERDIRRQRRGLSKSRGATLVANSDLLVQCDLFHEAAARSFRPRDLDRLDLDRGAVQRVRRDSAHLLRLLDGSLPRAPEPDDEEAALLKSILAGFPDRVARRRKPNEPAALMVGGRGVRLAEESVVRDAELFVATQLRGVRGPNALVRSATAIEESWLAELFPHALRESHSCLFDAERESVITRKTRGFHDLPLEVREVKSLDLEKAGDALASALLAAPEKALQPSEGVQRLLSRLRFLKEACPEMELPAATLGWLAEQLVPLCYGKRSFAELRRIALAPIVNGLLSSSQRRALATEAPERLDLPAGGSARIHYEDGKPPKVSARVQALFGLHRTPHIARGRVPLLMEILAPSRRPVQLTSDLESFWSKTYTQVRKDLRARYPKHAWPEHPK